MKPQFPKFPRLCVKFAANLLIIAACAAGWGCSSSQGTLSLTAMDTNKGFQQNFDEAYIARSGSGDTDIVLVQDSIQPVKQDPDRPLVPDARVNPRQLVHIRVFWTPLSGVKADHPANTNASIHWCIVCDQANPPGVIDYCGSGLVVVKDNGDGATVTIRKAWMKVGCRHGSVADPLGPSFLAGKFQATNNPNLVREIRDELQAATAKPDASASSDTATLAATSSK